MVHDHSYVSLTLRVYNNYPYFYHVGGTFYQTIQEILFDLYFDGILGR